MNDLLTALFGWVCGQDPGHLWAPGGTALCCCQRCTGLYAGAVVGLLSHLLARPRHSGRFLMIHGLFLVLMVPLGYHWVPQGPLLRTVSGYLFALAVVTYLNLVPRRYAGAESDRGARPRWYVLGVSIGLGATLMLAASQAAAALVPLMALVGIGALVFGLLALVNFVEGVRWVIRSAARLRG